MHHFNHWKGEKNRFSHTHSKASVYLCCYSKNWQLQKKWHYMRNVVNTLFWSNTQMNESSFQKKKSISYVFLSLSQKVPTIIIYVKLIKFRLENIILDKLQRVNFPTNKLFCNLSLERQVFWRTWRLGKIWQKFDPKIFFSILVAEEVDFSANSCKKNTILNSKLDF